MEEKISYCSQVCQQAGISPAGTVKILSSATAPVIGFLLVEINEPNTQWNSRIETLELFSGLDNYIKSNPDIDLRLQAIRKQTTVGDMHRVIIYLRGRQLHGPFMRYEYCIPGEQLLDGIVEIFDKDMNSDYVTESSTERDILLCVHQQRDQCCGKFGHDLYTRISDNLPENTEIWMSSHLGGHRMAPTLLDLPYGRYWGYVNRDFATKLIRRVYLSKKEINDHYRGFVGVPSIIQLADREGIVHDQWKWMAQAFRYQIEGREVVVTSKQGKQIRAKEDQISTIYVGETSCADLRTVLVPHISILSSDFSQSAGSYEE